MIRLVLVLLAALTASACTTTPSCNMGDHSPEWIATAFVEGCAAANRKVGR
jgi:hypothetical protein